MIRAINVQTSAERETPVGHLVAPMITTKSKEKVARSFSKRVGYYSFSFSSMSRIEASSSSIFDSMSRILSISSSIHPWTRSA